MCPAVPRIRSRAMKSSFAGGEVTSIVPGGRGRLNPANPSGPARRRLVKYVRIRSLGRTAHARDHTGRSAVPRTGRTGTVAYRPGRGEGPGRRDVPLLPQGPL